MKNKILFTALFVCSSLIAFAQNKFTNSKPLNYHEYHVSVNGNDNNEGSVMKPLKTIMAAANKAMPGDVITVHAGVYREQITPPRGGNSENERIIYQVAKGEKVEIKGSEIITGWRKLNHDTWEVKIPNTFFGTFNPYSDTIHGDWFYPIPKERKYHTGAVYLNGDWLMEAASQPEVMRTANEKNQLWWAEVDSTTTTIWAQFKNVDPNKETTEINARQTIFYPNKPFINFITVRGFVMQHAATNWAPPTAEQMGLIGTHWSRGWIIENNTVQYSKCVGIALGKYGDEQDGRPVNSDEGYVGTIKRALAFGWNKSTIGGHVVRNNTVAYCEQAGIVGGLGCSFSRIENNVIHDIHVRNLFSGAEMAGIKFHGAVDVQITGNHIYRTNLGMWMDWMAQGTQIKNNLMDQNESDVFIEVSHGPTLFSNNIFLSANGITLNSQGVAFVHNLFGGKIKMYTYDRRITPYLLPHSTEMTGSYENPGGDVQFFNNLFVDSASARFYDKSLQPTKFVGNVYTKGTNLWQPKKSDIKCSKPISEIQPKLLPKTESGEMMKPDFDAAVSLVEENKSSFLNINFDKTWLSEKKRPLITTTLLGKAIIPNQPYVNPDGSALSIDTDYFGNKRNVANPSPGPFEILKTGKQTIKVWTK